MFTFYDELRPAGDEPIRVVARIYVLTTDEGGRRGPFTVPGRQWRIQEGPRLVALAELLSVSPAR